MCMLERRLPMSLARTAMALAALLALAAGSGAVAQPAGHGCRIEPETRCPAGDIAGADLYAADLRGADLSGANLAGANLQLAGLRGAVLSGADLQGARLAGARLRSVVLAG